MLYLLLLFTLVPLLELYILVYVGQQIGFWETCSIVLLTGIVGAFLARIEGFFIIKKINSEIRRGIIPQKDLIHGVMLLIGAVLLITPGIITDVVGLLLLLPGSRDVIRIIFTSKIKNSSNIHGFSSQSHEKTHGNTDIDDPNIIDSELVR